MKKDTENPPQADQPAAGKQKIRKIDAALIRAAAAQIKIYLDTIAIYEAGLQHELNGLHEELDYTDPVKDKLFEKFMYMLARFINELGPSYEFSELVQAMSAFGETSPKVGQKFHAPDRAEQAEAPSTAMPGQVIDVIPLRRCCDNSIISEEVIHA